MKLVGLLPLLQEMPLYRSVLGSLKRKSDPLKVALLPAARPCLLAALFREWAQPMLVVAAKSEGARRLYEELLPYLDEESLHLFPEPDTLPYEPLPPDPALTQQRLRVLSLLPHSRRPPLVVASAYALAHLTTPPGEFASSCYTLREGMALEPQEALARWLALGYEPAPAVEFPGQMSRRGGLLDLFSPQEPLPVRIELLGNTIASLRHFEPSSQRSVAPLTQATVTPAQEQPDSSTTLLDHLPGEALIVVEEPQGVAAALQELETQAEELRQARRERGEMPGDSPRPYLPAAELEAKLQERKLFSLTSFNAETALAEPPPLPFTSAPGFAGRWPEFVAWVKDTLRHRNRLLIVSAQARRLSELFQEEDLFAEPREALERPPPPGSLTLLQGSLAQGWQLSLEKGNLVLLTDAEVFGFAKKPRRGRRTFVSSGALLAELEAGDYVVHVEHGIARFAGIKRMAAEGREGDYLVLEYAEGDKLYVPVDQADRVGRYVGPGDYGPTLSRLGTQEWARAKERVKEAAQKLAQELLSLYAARQVHPGFAYSPDTPWQQELEASFPYAETPDQLRAVQEVKQDMESPRPMDRLVCGDVGYGKTEVGLRAAFKAVMEGKQVAVLVPTTILAQQHYVTFSERLRPYPVRVEVLSRFRSEKEQQGVLRGLELGTIDICIGTHRLLQKDVSFKDLGLVIIDEEQRFGVAHKEKLKQMRREVEALTLSATPIPRTLHLSLVGVRDVSTMETPPEERLPIKTHVSPYGERLAREAILRELERGGQVFFVHNRVRSIDRVARELEALVPEARIAVAHGQMDEEELERVMLEFSQKRYDVLLCTTIIESGLDMPNVNTLIVNDAHKLGLSQLYQLRGRVGRGVNRAYAYFLYPRGQELTEAAEKRLGTIFEATELGAGFRIAMKDLEIRGAGNILGPEQSGHIGAVGYDLYSRLLAEAVEELKVALGREKARPAPPPVTIDLPLRAYFPEDWVPEPSLRLQLYQRLAHISRLEEVEEVAQELQDRFGPLPLPAQNLLYMVRMKVLASERGVRSVSQEEGEIVLRMREERPWPPGALPRGRVFRTAIRQLRLDVKTLGGRWPAVLEEVMEKLADIKSKS